MLRAQLAQAGRAREGHRLAYNSLPIGLTWPKTSLANGDALKKRF